MNQINVSVNINLQNDIIEHFAKNSHKINSKVTVANADLFHDEESMTDEEWGRAWEYWAYDHMVPEPDWFDKLVIPAIIITGFLGLCGVVGTAIYHFVNSFA